MELTISLPNTLSNKYLSISNGTSVRSRLKHAEHISDIRNSLHQGKTLFSFKLTNEKHSQNSQNKMHYLLRFVVYLFCYLSSQFAVLFQRSSEFFSMRWRENRFHQTIIDKQTERFYISSYSLFIALSILIQSIHKKQQKLVILCKLYDRIGDISYFQKKT